MTDTEGAVPPGAKLPQLFSRLQRAAVAMELSVACGQFVVFEQAYAQLLSSLEEISNIIEGRNGNKEESPNETNQGRQADSEEQSGGQAIEAAS